MLTDCLARRMSSKLLTRFRPLRRRVASHRCDTRARRPGCRPHHTPGHARGACGQSADRHAMCSCHLTALVPPFGKSVRVFLKIRHWRVARNRAPRPPRLNSLGVACGMYAGQARRRRPRPRFSGQARPVCVPQGVHPAAAPPPPAARERLPSSPPARRASPRLAPTPFELTSAAAGSSAEQARQLAPGLGRGGDVTYPFYARPWVLGENFNRSVPRTSLSVNEYMFAISQRHREAVR